MLSCFDANLIHFGHRDNNNEHELSLSSFVELYRVVRKRKTKTCLEFLNEKVFWICPLSMHTPLFAKEWEK